MTRSFLPAVALLLALSAALPAQNSPRDGARPVQAQPAAQQSGGDLKSIDECVARCLALCNGSEIALAEFAKGRVSDQRVKDFVAMLHTDHQQCLDKLAQVNPQSTQMAADVRTSAQSTPEDRQNDQTRTSERPDASKTRQPVQGSHPPGDHASRTGQPASADTMATIEKDAAANCLRLTMAELERQPAGNFDMAFVGFQIGGHVHMIAKLEAVQPHVSAEMRPMVDQCLESARQHMDEARKLAEALGQEEAAGK